jgi:hypothetical protein
MSLFGLWVLPQSGRAATGLLPPLADRRIKKNLAVLPILGPFSRPWPVTMLLTGHRHAARVFSDRDYLEWIDPSQETASCHHQHQLDYASA